MIRILFICHGNICRSPMAEWIMKDMADRAGRSGEFEIASAATSTEELGNPMYPPARRKLAEHGIPFGSHAARQMTAGDYEYYDLIIAMDTSNLRGITRICGSDRAGKVSLLMSHAGKSGSVADPWYTGDFETAWRDITEGCSALMEKL